MDVWLLLNPDHGKEMAAWLRKEKGCHAVAKALFLGSLSAQSDVSVPRQDYRSQIGTGQSEMPR